MSKDEFLFLIPGVIYGMVVFDLISLLRSKKYYWESLFWGALMFFELLTIVYHLFDDLVLLTSNLGYYTLFIFSPLLFVQGSFSLTPKDENENMELRFSQKRQAFFGSLTGVLVVNFIIRFFITGHMEPIQHATLLILIGLNVIFDKMYLRLFTGVLVGITVIYDYWSLLAA